MKTTIVNECEDKTLIITEKYRTLEFSKNLAKGYPGYVDGDLVVGGTESDELHITHSFLVDQKTYDSLKVGDKINLQIQTTTITTNSIVFI